MRLQNKVAIITGGGRGLGRAVALAFGREGAKVVLAARTRDEVDHVAEELRILRKEALAAPVDVTREDQVDRMVQRTLEAYGTIDILVNNAGARGPIVSLRHVSLADWEETMRINLTSAFLCSRAVLPTLMAKKQGKIINVATTLNPRPNLTPYMVAKAGLIQLTKQLSRELKEFHIQVNAIHPGVMDTRMQEEIRKAGPQTIGTDMFERLKEEGMLHSPGEPAQLIIYLATAAADGINGEYLSFDDKDVKFLIAPRGNVREEDFRRIWEKEPYRAFRQIFAARRKACRDALQLLDRLALAPPPETPEEPPPPLSDLCRTCYKAYGI